MKPLTVEELTNWEEHGATWRLLEDEGTLVRVEMCTCYGEPVDVREGTSAELIELVRARRTSEGGGRTDEAGGGRMTG